MKISEIISEAPIAGVTLQGDPWENLPFDQGTSFGKIDKKILSSKKGIAKIIRAFKKTPFVFEIFFVNNIQIGGDNHSDNENVDGIAAHYKAGIHDEWGDIHSKPGVIRVILISNLSPIDAKIPITGWMLAHKIGHSIQDFIESTSWNGKIGKAVQHINEIAQNIFFASVKPTKWTALPAYFMTTKSAETGNLTNEFEIFAELIAQYLITGRVKLRNLNPEKEHLVPKLNAAIEHLFKILVGHILLEV